ncbi:potassium transporter TrkA, partial [Streptomyces sp. NRRL WC-3753]
PAVPSPTPDFRFAIGDSLVVVGTREGVDAVAELITGG